MQQLNNITGIILAGGKSTRMGTDKAMLQFQGKTFLQILYDKLKVICSDVIVSSNNPKISIESAETVPDKISDIGPMGGIYTCLKHSKTEKNIIISIDSPFVNIEFLQYLLKQSREHVVTISEFKKKIHPLIGIYRKNFVETLKKEIASKHYKMLIAVQKTDHKIINISEEMSFFDKGLFLNINTLEELEKAEEYIP